MPPIDWHRMWLPTLSPFEVMLRAAFIYVVAIALFRLAGRKELGRYSPFDIVYLFLITVAARQSIVANDTSLTSSVVGLATLMALDVGFSWISYKSARASRLLDGPVLQLICDGELQGPEMRRARLTVTDLIASLRHQHGLDSLDEVRHAFLDKTGAVSFVLRDR